MRCKRSLQAAWREMVAVNKTAGVPLVGFRGLLVLWMFVLSAVAYVDRVNISIAGQAIAHEYRLTNVQLGWVFSAFVIGYALFQAPTGRLVDRVGLRRALTLDGLFWGVFTSPITLVSPRWAWVIAGLIAVRFSMGIGEAIVYPASNAFVARWIPSSEKGIANRIIFAGVGFGAVGQHLREACQAAWNSRGYSPRRQSRASLSSGAPNSVSRLRGRRQPGLAWRSTIPRIRISQGADSTSIMKNDFSYHDINVLVTGASSGIGAATAIAFARHGANLLVHYNSKESEARVVLEEVLRHGVEARLVRADLITTEGTQKLAEFAASQPIGILVNSAG